MVSVRKYITLLFCIWCIIHTVSAEDTCPIKERPRLFLTNQRIEELKVQADEVSIQLKEIILHYAGEALSLPAVTYPEKEFRFAAMRETQRRILYLSMSYLLTGEEKYFRAAKEVLMRLSALDDWGTNHFLDVGEAALAAGIGIDWLYHALSAGERQTITDAIVKNALIPALSMQPSENGSSWVNGNFNWNPVCHGGTLAGALAIAGSEPQLSRRIIERAIKYIPVASQAFEPDGSDSEGPSYWSYGASFNVIAIEALRTATGSAHGLDTYQGFLKSGEYKNQVQGVTGEYFNYSDYHLEKNNEPVMLWFGRELERYDLVEKELKDIYTLHQQLQVTSANNTYFDHSQNAFVSRQSETESTNNPVWKVFASRHIPLELIWWNPALSGKEHSTASLHWTATGGLPLGITRSSWNDPEAAFIAIKGGTPNHSHGHMDVGSFILEKNGVRWALDLGVESYNKMRAAKLDLWNYSQHSSRWSVFRVGPEGHNILRFDGEPQQVSGYATIEPLVHPDGSAGHRVDLSSLYTNKACSVKRSVLLHPDKTMTILDEWEANNPDETVSWQWLTVAEVTKTNRGFLLRQNGKSLEVNIEYPVSLSGLTVEVEDMSEPRNIQDSPNPDLKRIVIKLPVGNKSGKLHMKIM